MAGNVANPRIWLQGDAYYAPVGTTAPTDVATALAAAWKAFGLLHEDGLTEQREDEENKFYAWGNVYVRTVRSRHNRSFRIRALEDNKDIWPVLNPGSPTPVTATGITTRIVKSPQANPLAFVFHMVDGTNIKRLVIPRGEAFVDSDVVYGEGDMASRELRIDVYAASDGTLYNEITNDPQAVVP